MDVCLCVGHVVKDLQPENASELQQLAQPSLIRCIAEALECTQFRMTQPQEDLHRETQHFFPIEDL